MAPLSVANLCITASYGAGKGAVDHVDVPTVVPAHIGLATYYLETGDYAEAIRIGEAGLTIADRSGYVAWSLQWLLPVVGERDIDGDTGQPLSWRAGAPACNVPERSILAARDQGGVDGAAPEQRVPWARAQRLVDRVDPDEDAAHLRNRVHAEIGT